MLFQRIFYPLHGCQDLLLLQPLPDYLHANRQAMHRVCVIMFICAFSYTVELVEVKPNG